MDFIHIKKLYQDLDSYNEQSVTICGWIRSLRDSKSFGFISINDGTYFQPVQVVFDNTLENFDTIRKLNIGSALIIKGNVLVTPNARQPFEIHAESITIEGTSTPDYPLQKKRHSFEYLRTIPHLRPRTNTFQAVFRVRSLIAYAIHQFFQDRKSTRLNSSHRLESRMPSSA